MNRRELQVKHAAKIALMGSSLLLLASCDFGGKKKDAEQEAGLQERSASSACTVADDPLAGQGTVLVTMDGKPVVSDKSFNVHYARLLNENPQFKSFLENSTEAKKNTLNGLAAQIAIDEYLCRTGIDKTAEYMADLEAQMQANKRMLNLKYFTDKMDVKVADDEVRAAYDKMKDVNPQFLVSRGGVKAVGVAFDTEAEAQALAQKIGKGLLADQAKTAGVADKVRDFKLVNAGTFGIDPLVRDVVVAMTEFPSVKVVKGKDQKFWVVQATGMEEKQYRPFDAVKEEVRAMAQREKGMKMFEQELERLKKEYNIIVNDTFFGASTPADQDALIRELEQMVGTEQQEEQA